MNLRQTVARSLRDAGLGPTKMSVRPGRDSEHVRVRTSPGLPSTQEARHLHYATTTLRLAGFEVEPGLQEWYIIVSPANQGDHDE